MRGVAVVLALCCWGVGALTAESDVVKAQASPLRNDETRAQLLRIYRGGAGREFGRKLEAASMQVHGNSVVVAVTVTWAAIDFFENWRCSLLRHSLNTSFLVFAMDERTHNYMEAHGHHSVLYNAPVKGGSSGVTKGEPLRFRTQVFYEMIQQRNYMVFSAVAAGYSILLADIDAVWMRDPLVYLGSAQEMDFGLVLDNPRAMLASEPKTIGQELCGGFVYFRSCAATKRMLLQTINRFWMPRYFFNEQKLLSFLLYPPRMRLYPWRWAKVRWLPKPEFPSGKEFFEDYSDEQRSRAVVIHNNWIPTHAKKKGRFVEHGFWYIREGANHSEAQPSYECPVLGGQS